MAGCLIRYQHDWEYELATSVMQRNYSRWLIGLIFIVIVFAADVLVTHNVLTDPFPGHNDFMSRWEGARSYWIDGLNPYSDEVSLNIQDRIYGRPVENGEDPGYFAYPFYTVFLVWPLVYTSYAWASAIWMVLLEAALIASLFILFDLFRWKPAPLIMAALILWTLFFYFPARGLILGQVGLLVYFFEVVAIWAVVKRYDSLAAVALAISTVKPQMGFLIVPFLLLWGLRERRWKFVIVFVVTMLILLGVSFVMEPSWFGDWVAQLRNYPSYTAIGSPVWIIVTYYLGLGSWAEIAVSGLLALLMFITWYWVLWKGNNERFLWVTVLTLTVTHLIAPRTATPHYVIFILPLVFYFALISRRHRRRGSLWIVLILFALLVLSWVHFLLTVVKQFEHPSLYLPLPIAILVILWWTRRQWWESSPAKASTA